jgi:ElaB/YqjD/DUF883 family membrane-anchored ribosome-binding protein
MARATGSAAGAATSSTADTKGIQERFSKQIEQAREKVSEGLDSARERLGDVQTQASDLWDDAVDYVRENPGKVIAFSVGIGLGLGLLMRMRSMNLSEQEYAE